MAKQRIVWTALPFGRTAEGRLRVSVVVSPRLTPEAEDEQRLKAFPRFLDWPAQLAELRLGLRVAGTVVPLEVLAKPDPALWFSLFDENTPVAGFVFKDMSRVNLRSYALRNVLGFVRRHYGRMAVESAAGHPRLLPWREADDALKDLLGELGTRTEIRVVDGRRVEVLAPGFDRFHGGDRARRLEELLRGTVFGPNSVYARPVPGIGAGEEGGLAPDGTFPLRALPPDWQDPAGGGTDAGVMGQFTGAEEYTLYQADRFYRRTTLTEEQRAMRRPSYKNIPPPVAAPEYDFHQMAASLADMPQILRGLGLIIDCALPADSPIDAAAAAGDAAGLMGLELAWGSPQDGEDAVPRVAWQVSQGRFLVRPRGRDHQRGLLRLAGSGDRWSKETRSAFDVYQVDPDGTALKTADFVLSAQNLVGRSLRPGTDGAVTYTTGDEQPVAALRSGGLGVSRHGRATMVAQDAAAAALKNTAVEGSAADKVVLFLEDVHRGYRVDVQPVPDVLGEGRWMPLCARSGSYRLVRTGETRAFVDDEGYVKGASTTSAEDAPEDHYLHESLFRWGGWSLVAPRPGRTIRAEPVADSALQGERPQEVTDEASSGNGVVAQYAARRGSLPRLRFGQLYRFRARVVDLAGNSLEIDDPSLAVMENATDAVGYWRFEPVDPPVLVHRARVSEGESLERMVIRSNHNAAPEAYLSSPAFAEATKLPASADFEYTAVNERHLVPPKASQLQCEQHGLLDSLMNDPASIRDAYAISAREAGALHDPSPGALVELVTPQSVAGAATTATLPPRLPSPDNPVGDRLVGGQYVIHREALLRTPYLPDGAAGGVALRAMPGHALPGVAGPMVLGPSAAVIRAPDEALVLVVAHRASWPDSTGFRLRLVERSAVLGEMPCREEFPDPGLPRWDEDTRELTFFVAKGRIVRLRYASFVNKDLLGSFGLPHWVEDAAQRQFVLGMAQLGCHWMITPFRPLTLVRATQQPVCEPEMFRATAVRQPGDHHATLIAQVRLHGPSTGKIEIEAEWDEWEDDPAKPAPLLLKNCRGQLAEVPLAENHENLFSLTEAVEAHQAKTSGERARGDRHDLGDTKFRLVRYRPRAATRFREYLPPSLYAQVGLVTRLGPMVQGDPVAVGAEDDPGAPVLLDPSGGRDNIRVRSSAPPAEPRLLYTVPTFRWHRAAEAPGAADVTRLGNGLRVYLERPWFSSGDGELLGVVILHGGRPFKDIPDRLALFVTQWGLDPLWETAAPKMSIKDTDFPARVAAETVTLRELDGDDQDETVRVVGHRVHWNNDRRLWYCDIELEPGAAYMPFVRLALARYQPNALAEAEISKVVLAEFAQLLPRRRAVLSQDGTRATVRLHGPVPVAGPVKIPGMSEYMDPALAAAAQETGRNRVELVLQTREPGLESDLAWTDDKVLADAILAPAGAGAPKPPGTLATEEAEAGPATIRNRLGKVIEMEGMLERTDGILPSQLPQLLDPAIWTAQISLPATDGPRRLMLREFERFYADRFVTERRGITRRRRRCIEERLVYATTFELAPQ